MTTCGVKIVIGRSGGIRGEGPSSQISDFAPLFVIDNDCLHVEKKADDVAVFDDVVAAFLHVLSDLFHFLFASQFDQVLIFHHLGPYESAFEVGVDHARCLGGQCPLSIRPRPHFVGADREKRNQSEGVVAEQGQPVQSRLVEMKLFEKNLALRRVKLGKLLFDLGGDRNPLETLCRELLFE